MLNPLRFAPQLLKLALALGLALQSPFPVLANEGADPAGDGSIKATSITLPVIDPASNQAVDALTFTVTELNPETRQALEAAAQASNVPIVEIPVISEASQQKSFLGKISSRLTRKITEFRAKHRGALQGLAFAATSSSMGAMGLYFVGDATVTETAIIGTTMMSIAVFHGVFTNTWQSYLQKGLYLKNFLGLFNPALKENELVRSAGNVLAAATFNIFPTAIALHYLGGEHAWYTIAAIGALGAYDYTIDIAAGKLERRGRITEKTMKGIVRTRMLTGPVLEMFSLGGSSGAQVAMGTVAITGLGAILRGEKLVDDIYKIKNLAITFRPAPTRSCDMLLAGMPSHIRAFEDVQ